MKTAHLVAAVACIVLAIFAAPFVKERFDEAEGKHLSRSEKLLFDLCRDAGFSGWQKKKIELCMAWVQVAGLDGGYEKMKAEAKRQAETLLR